MGFPKTRHSAILGLRDQDEQVRRQSYETTIAAYWQPVNTYLRLRWRESEEDSADLTQAFFSKALEAATLTSYDPAKGTFRTYLRTCLDHFVLNARKRAGRAEPLPLDFDVATTADAPDDVFHREWVRSLFSLAVEDLHSSHDDVRFRVFERYDLNEAETRPTYADLALEFGISTISVTNYLAAMRRDFRKAVLNRLRDLTVNEREFRAEARAILGVEV